MNRALQSYHDQWVAVHALEKKTPSGKEEHPLDFASIFNSLYARSGDVAVKCSELEKSLLETRKAFDETSRDLLIQVKQFETLGSESNQTKSSLTEMTATKARLEDKVKDLKHELLLAQEAKEEANQRLKTVLGRVCEFVEHDF